MSKVIRHSNPFCSQPYCQTYLGSSSRCPHCQQPRQPLEIPAAENQPLWTTTVEGMPATDMLLAGLGEASQPTVLIVPWSILPQRGVAAVSDGGVTMVRLADGELLCSYRFGMTVEGGGALHGRHMYLGLSTRGLGAGVGWVVALDLDKGTELWRTPLGGAVRSRPVVDQARLLVTCTDGCLYCLDLQTGTIIWKERVYAGECQIPAPPVPVRSQGVLRFIFVGTYGGLQGREEGHIMALDERGKKLWDHGAGGNVRGEPVVYQDTLYVAAFRSGPSAGLINAYDLRNGRPRWPQPFIVQGQPTDRTSYNFAAAPLAYEDRIYVGSLNGVLYALDAQNGRLIWEQRVGGGIATKPALVEEYLVFGANDGRVYALEIKNGEMAWHYPLGAASVTNPLVWEGVVLAAASDGCLAALSWHLGHYTEAASRLEIRGRLEEAGDLRALSGHFSLQPEKQEQAYRQAAEDWMRAGHPERAAQLWLALNRRHLAAETYHQAGLRWQMHEPERAARYFELAATEYYLLHNHEGVNQCMQALAECASLPLILLEAANLGNLVQWEEGQLTLRLYNNGRVPAAGGIRLWLGGGLKSGVEAFIADPLLPGQTWNIPLTVTPTQSRSLLKVEAEYLPGREGYRPMRSMLEVELVAIEKPRPPLQIGDVGMLKLTIGGITAEGLHIITQDVGIVKAQGGIEEVRVDGQVGAVSAGGQISDLEIGGDVGSVRSGQSHSRKESEK